jgi:hypothetical protein
LRFALYKVCSSIGIFCIFMQKIHKCNRLLRVYNEEPRSKLRGMESGLLIKDNEN